MKMSAPPEIVSGSALTPAMVQIRFHVLEVLLHRSGHGQFRQGHLTVLVTHGVLTDLRVHRCACQCLSSISVGLVLTQYQVKPFGYAIFLRLGVSSSVVCQGDHLLVLGHGQSD